MLGHFTGKQPLHWKHAGHLTGKYNLAGNCVLFIIYMNDIHFASAYFSFILYADDTSLTQRLFRFNMETHFDDLNTELSKIYE